MYSGKPAASIVVTEAIAQQALEKPQGKRRLDPAGLAAADFIAALIAGQVDEALERKWSRRTGEFMEPEKSLMSPFPARAGRSNLLLWLGHSGAQGLD